MLSTRHSAQKVGSQSYRPDLVFVKPLAGEFVLFYRFLLFFLQNGLSVGTSGPAVGNSYLSVGNSGPAVGKSDSAVGNFAPGVGKSDSAVGNSIPAVGKSDSAVGNSIPAVGKSDSPVGNPDPAAGRKPRPDIQSSPHCARRFCEGLFMSAVSLRMLYAKCIYRKLYEMAAKI